jgi:hypothetical protein
MHQYADTVAFAVETAADPLPADVAAMIAPSITVTAGPAAVDVAASIAPSVVPEPPRVELVLYRATMPVARGGRHRRSGRAG